MGRNSYDDMPSTFKGRNSNRKNILVALCVVLVLVICFIIYIAFKPAEEIPLQEERVVRTDTSIGVVVPAVEEVVVAPVEKTEPDAEVAESETEKKSSGESVLFQSFRKYTVQRGDTLSSIARSFSLEPETIASVNSITDQTSLAAGSILQIPPVDGQLYEVKEGDMLSQIIRKYNPSLNYKELMAMNGLESETIKAGMKIFVPSPEIPESEADDKIFLRPCDGAVKYSFGELYNDRKLDGVAIEMAPGEAVKSVSKGFVTDVGNDSELGRFVTVMHDNGYKSYYYCLETVLVRLGQTVEEGSIIGSVGTSSRYFGSPCLFFKLEQGALKLDPMLFL